MTLTAWQKKLPLYLTMSRVAVVPFIAMALYIDSIWGRLIAAFLFILGSISDYYDGYFARKYDLVSTTGKFMDPVADKIMVNSVMVILLAFQKIDMWMLMFVIARDTLIGALRAIAAADQIIVAAKPMGKWKTAMQMSAMPILILGPLNSLIPYIDQLAYVVLWTSVILGLTSGWDYYCLYLDERNKKGV
ncbi:MAG: CDP-diacylglycerol--glycerol-3-phosphate 3-phosphatidyltransferase [Pseudobdellovibrionaceae bacterium]